MDELAPMTDMVEIRAAQGKRHEATRSSKSEQEADAGTEAESWGSQRREDGERSGNVPRGENYPIWGAGGAFFHFAHPTFCMSWDLVVPFFRLIHCPIRYSLAHFNLPLGPNIPDPATFPRGPFISSFSLHLHPPHRPKKQSILAIIINLSPALCPLSTPVGFWGVISLSSFVILY